MRRAGGGDTGKDNGFTHAAAYAVCNEKVAEFYTNRLA